MIGPLLQYCPISSSCVFSRVHLLVTRRRTGVLSYSDDDVSSDCGAGCRCCYRESSGRARILRRFDAVARGRLRSRRSRGGAEGRIRSRGSRGGARSRLLPAEKAVEVLDVGISLMCLLCFDAGLSPFCSCNEEMFKTFCCVVKRHGCDAATIA